MPTVHAPIFSQNKLYYTFILVVWIVCNNTFLPIRPGRKYSFYCIDDTLVHNFFISDFQVTDMEYEANVQYATENSNLPANVAINLTQDQSRAKNDRLYAVLYTSGSTGTPKGARILHSAVLNRLMWQWEKFPYQPNDVCAFKVSTKFFLSNL